MLLIAESAAPHARGWTCLAGREVDKRYGDPARAGMNLDRLSAGRVAQGRPRAGGDEPVSIIIDCFDHPGAPRGRG